MIKYVEFYAGNDLFIDALTLHSLSLGEKLKCAEYHKALDDFL